MNKKEEKMIRKLKEAEQSLEKAVEMWEELDEDTKGNLIAEQKEETEKQLAEVHEQLKKYTASFNKIYRFKLKVPMQILVVAEDKEEAFKLYEKYGIKAEMNYKARDITDYINYDEKIETLEVSRAIGAEKSFGGVQKLRKPREL